MSPGQHCRAEKKGTQFRATVGLAPAQDSCSPGLALTPSLAHPRAQVMLLFTKQGSPSREDHQSHWTPSPRSPSEGWRAGGQPGDTVQVTHMSQAVRSPGAPGGTRALTPLNKCKVIGISSVTSQKKKKKLSKCNRAGPSGASQGQTPIPCPLFASCW